MKVICKLAALMEAQDIDQKTVAAQTGLSPTTVGKLYRGHFNRIDNHTVVSLCKFFQLKTISDLIEIQWEESDVQAGVEGG
ncbi:MAG: helix-turn-helix transcriptional regulator [Leptolyngbya sp. SIO3F4]|nr:helix-turn-helix transcriptional regulator [Leptolyngbya sp. SIO3F4]